MSADTPTIPTGATDPAAAADEPDFYTENGFVVFTAAFLLRRGYCCGNGCRHCPYEDESGAQPQQA